MCRDVIGMSKSIITEPPGGSEAMMQRCTCLSHGRLHSHRGTISLSHDITQGKHTVFSMSRMGVKGKMVIRRRDSISLEMRDAEKTSTDFTHNVVES